MNLETLPSVELELACASVLCAQSKRTAAFILQLLLRSVHLGPPKREAWVADTSGSHLIGQAGPLLSAVPTPKLLEG